MEDILLVHRKSNRNFSEALQDAAIWKTCLRKILFCREDELNNFLDYLEPEDKVLRGEEALTLLLEILCGLHSPIVGETEVLGQFRAFVESRKQIKDALFSDSQKWLNFITSEVKKTRSEHLVGIGSQSYGSLLRRYTKDLDSVTICGSGQLAQEILPWVAHKKSVQIICRNPAKLQAFAEKYDNLTISTYNEAFVHGEAMVIAAPVGDARILELLGKQDTRPQGVFDLRGEDNKLADLAHAQHPHVKVMSLQQFFSEIEENKKDTQTKLETIKAYLLEKALAFTQRTELRPLGWDDICA
ncbi:NAD(P)-binding domain-containing protein [Bdellovibrio svalbardensis]|uniref:NAD(P)-binding domain-containing protein n=1 Tax=Bdellovibrio svalbardensis TaxID=2972972 RepID=A0ABT6DEP3_9BACT|nr:NAD(P)-binding domain-containing protein [Bdellovibrio svalbardensis]MDG0815310.1 NAD(P)-binding domain-containing protein [Bdellovibrio svalbardensis]